MGQVHILSLSTPLATLGVKSTYFSHLCVFHQKPLGAPKHSLALHFDIGHYNFS